MRITVFQSDKGDCLLVKDATDTNMLVDGGMASSYRRHARPALARMRDDDEALDLVYVSHIDQDHISGVLQMMNDEMDWRRFEFHQQSGTGSSRVRRPRFGRPPPIKQVWHNAFHTLLRKNRGRIRDALAANVPLLNAGDGEFEAEAIESHNLVTSMTEAVRLSNRLGARQLNIPLNAAFDGKLALRPSRPEYVRVGRMNVSVLGPSKRDLKRLRDKWNDWLDDNRSLIHDLRREATEDARAIGNTASDDPFLFANLAANRIGNRSAVSAPNLASLMLLVEERGQCVLLTGDGHPDDVLEGLKDQRKLRPDESLHVDVLKVPHHGSEHNMTKDFAKKVTADHYVFCGNGFSGNPEPVVIKALINSRLGSRSQRSSNPEVDRPFTFWFNTHEDVTKYPPHMRAVEGLVKNRAARSHGRLVARFLKRSSFDIRL